MLWTVCTCACAKPIPEIVPMLKLDIANRKLLLAKPGNYSLNLFKIWKGFVKWVTLRWSHFVSTCQSKQCFQSLSEFRMKQANKQFCNFLRLNRNNLLHEYYKLFIHSLIWKLFANQNFSCICVDSFYTHGQKKTFWLPPLLLST